MTPELETALRAMLRERANDIVMVPHEISEAAREQALELGGTRRPARGYHRTAWLTAAVIAALLAVVGTAVALSIGGSHRAPTATQAPKPVRSGEPTRPPTPRGHAERRVSLAWFGMKQIAGYVEHARASEPGYRSLAVRARSDSGVPVGCNGCESASAYIYVLDKGRFTGAAAVHTWTKVQVGETTGYLGTMPAYPDGKHNLATVAWQFRAGEWALVQGVTAVGSTRAALLRIARAVEPARAVPIQLPFRLDYLPSVPIAAIVDDRDEGYAFTLNFGSIDGVSVDITLWDRATLAGVYDTSHAVPRRIGGLPGYVNTTDGAVARYAGGIALFGVSGVDATIVGQSPAQVAAQTQAVLSRILDGLHWTNGTGRPPYLAAERAIP